MKPTSLSSRLVVVMAVALAPAFIVTAYSLLTLLSAQNRDLHVEARRIAELVSLELDQTVTGAEAVLRTVAVASNLELGSAIDCRPLLERITRDVDYLAAVQILNADGSVACTSGPPEAAVDVDDVWIASLPVERSVGLATRLGAEGTLTLPIGVRLEGGEGWGRPAAVAYLDLSWLEMRLQGRTLTAGGALTIADRGGTILARVPEPERFVGTKIPAPYDALVGSEFPGSTQLLSQDGTERIIGYYPPAANEAGLYVSAGLSKEEGYAAIRSVANRAALLSLAVILLIGTFAYFTARRMVVAPVQKVIDTVAEWRNGNFAARTGLDPREGEICRAGHSVDAFMDELVATREARRQADAARDLLRGEIEHREKNLIATVQAIARQTFPGEANASAYKTFAERLNALDRANGLLKQSSWQSASLRDLVNSTVETFVGKDKRRIRMVGPEIVVKASVATILAMAIHELCTNASKYGALSNETGTIDIEWVLTGPSDAEQLSVSWVERGGPPVTGPLTRGFGTRIIRDALATQTAGTVEIAFKPKGLEVRLTAPASAVLHRPGLMEQTSVHLSGHSPGQSGAPVQT